MTKKTVRRVLVIDDDPDYRSLLKRFLGKAFPAAVCVEFDPIAQGRPPVEFDWASFDVLLLDLRLGPNENGLDWLRTFKKSGAAFPATIILSATGNDEVAVRALKFGAQDFLDKKGLNAKQLLASIHSAMSVHEQELAQVNELTLNSAQFSKGVFYQRLEEAAQSGGEEQSRALFLITINGEEGAGHPLGLAGLSKLTRHVARFATEVLRPGKFLPTCTLAGEQSVAVLVGDFGAHTALPVLAKKACQEFARRPFDNGVGGNTFSLSIGIVPLGLGFRHGKTALQAAAKACAVARKQAGNSFCLAQTGSKPSPAKKANESVKDALMQQRMESRFQVIMPISERSQRYQDRDLYRVGAGMVEVDGSFIEPDKVIELARQQNLVRMFERWLIRETIRRTMSVSQAEAGDFMLFTELSRESLADGTLDAWVDGLITHYGERLPERSVGLRVCPEALLAEPELGARLLNHLRERHGFQIEVYGILDAKQFNACLAVTSFDFEQFGEQFLDKLAQAAMDTEGGRARSLVAQGMNLLTIMDDIEDSAGLHRAVMAGVDFVTGDFVGAQQHVIGDGDVVEVVEMGSRDEPSPGSTMF